jgi:hypothetical protein
VRRESDVGGDAIAVQLVSVPDAIVFTVMEAARGLGLDLAMSRGLGEVNGIVQSDDRRGILYLSNIPKDITIHADFDAATVRAGYDGSSGINVAKALFTDLSKTSDPTVVHAYVELLQLPRAVSLEINRAGDAPRLVYNAATSTADVRAFVDEDLFGGDLRARALLWVDDLGAQTTLSLANVNGMQTLRLLSLPQTKTIFLEGFASQRYTGSMSQHLGDDCCLDSFGYDVWYGYNMAATIAIQNLRLRLTDVSALDFALHAPDLSVSGNFGEFTANWDTISLIGTSAAWLDVDLTVFWVDIDVWDWGWSSGTRYDLDLQIVRYADVWGPLASISISPCHLALNVHPYAVETMTNGFRFTGFTGQRQWLSINPIAGGQTAIPPWLMQGYMAWTHGGWALDWGC